MIVHEAIGRVVDSVAAGFFVLLIGLSAIALVLLILKFHDPDSGSGSRR